MRSNKVFERTVHGIFLILGLMSVACVLLITVYLVISGIPAVLEIGLLDFLFGKVWDPAVSDPQYGILPFILSSIYGTAGALVIGVPVGFFTAVYLSKRASAKGKEWMGAVVSLLAGIPSVVYGLVGMMVLGVGRAIGEAMAVMMVSGNVANMPGLFESVRFLTTAVSSGMGYADGLYRQVLFSIALVLFLFIMLINVTLNFFLKGEKK